MGTKALTTPGGRLISALAIGGMATVAVAVGVAADPVAPASSAATGLTTFEDCDALHSWYVDHTIDQVGPYGWGGRRWTTMRESQPLGDTAMATGSAAARDGVANGKTGTNTQESGVDEPDVAKTDGRLVVRLVERRRVVITDVTGAEPQDIGDWRLPSGSYMAGLLLVGHHVLLAGGMRGTELIDLDISQPARPRMDSTTSWSGRQLSLRQYGDTVRLVTSLGLPQLPFVTPRPGRLSEEKAEARNREIVRDSRVQDWVPGLDCDDVYHPPNWAGAETVAVATFHPGAVADASSVAVTGAGHEVYSSTDRLYVSSTESNAPIVMGRGIVGPDPDPDRGPGPGPGTFLPSTRSGTHIHAFALDGDTTRYVASGKIDGTVRDRWSLDEYDGHLRVAVSWPYRSGQTRENGVVVLDEQAGRLQQVGELRGLGVGEEIQSVRWFDDLAVVVTFRQLDPLYTIDLTDPARPRRLGELKIPGFSSYLHPIGGDRLLGIGTDATDEGRSLGAQAAVFDLSDASRMRQLGKATFGNKSRLGAGDDPHAFTWLPGQDAAITSLERMDIGADGLGLALLRVSSSGVLSTEDLPSPGGWEPRALPLQDGRVALVGDEVRLVSVTATGRAQ
jgi:uncharacterized secreted protein with C-terminal beta-propeller domain